MVSRSLEKMMLIAIGLTTVVVIGVPVLIFAMDTINTTTRIQAAESFAQQIFNASLQVDSGEVEEKTIQVVVPSNMTIEAIGESLIVTYTRVGTEDLTWSQDFSHQVHVLTPTTPGAYILHIILDEDRLVLEFSQV